MRLKIEPQPKLPPLAWVLRITSSQSAHLLCGRSVCIMPDGFADGAWEGPIDSAALHKSRYMLGSAGWLSADTLLLRTPSHSLERLWQITTPTATFFSNSLPLGLTASNTDFNTSNLNLEADLLSFIRGPTGIVGQIKLSKGAILRQHVQCVLEVRSPTDIKPRITIHRTTFENFGVYREHLSTICRRLAENASSAERARRYKPLVSISRGYDSPACAVLAREVGATEAFTFTRARPGYQMDDDDGSEVAKSLGLQVFRLDRESFRLDDIPSEPMFLASGGGGEDVILASAKNKLAGSLYFSGFLGDTVWSLDADWSRSQSGVSRYPNGGSIGEFRLHVNFIHLPLPILDLANHCDIQKISQGREMRPWRVGGEYDRPIPRRIAEEAGVSRTSFGIAKMAATEPMYYDRDYSDVWSQGALNSFDDFLRTPAHWPANPVSSGIYRVRRRLHWARERVMWRLEKGQHLRGLHEFIQTDLATRGRRHLSSLLLMPHWGIQQVQERYYEIDLFGR